MPVIKRSWAPLAIMLAASAVSLYFGAGSVQSLNLALWVVMPSALVMVWKIFAVMLKEWRSVENWLISILFLAVTYVLALLAAGDIGSYHFVL